MFHCEKIKLPSEKDVANKKNTRAVFVKKIDNAQLILQKQPTEQLIELMNPENAQIVAKSVDRLFEIRNFLINRPRRPI